MFELMYLCNLKFFLYFIEVYSENFTKLQKDFIAKKVHISFASESL